MEGVKVECYRKDPFLSSHYELLQLLGSGCFGKIFKAINKNTLQTVALKIQFYKNANTRLSTLNQVKVLQTLQGKEGVPRVYHHGHWSKGAFIQLEILQENLKQKINYTPTTITELTLELLNILEAVHAQNVIHQDLKPQNLMRSKEGKLYLIDFGLARILPRNRTGSHPVAGFTGTPRYASIQAHLCMEQSKKDDLESAFYNLACLYYQRLPWVKLKVSAEQKLQAIKRLKMKHNKTLFKEMPPQFAIAFDYISSLEPYTEPNYSYLKGLFKKHRSLGTIQPSQFELQERPKVKKVSLNLSNFLQVPEPRYSSKRKHQKDEVIEKDTRDKRPRQSESEKEYASDGSDNEMSNLRIYVNPISQLNLWESGDFEEQQDIEPQLPKSMHFGKTMILKNPFYMM